MRILLLGAHGLLGQALQTAFATAELTAWGREACDITRPETRTRIETAKPEVVVNAAAWTDVDGAEAPAVWDDVLQINACCLARIAQACNELNAQLVHISTNEVFPGTPEQCYAEEAPVQPINAYGRSKALGEQIAKQATRHCIVRVSWLFGPHGDHFPRKIVRAADRYGQLRVVADEFGSPTYTLDAASRIARLACTQAQGVFHVTNQGIVSRYEWARYVLQHTNRGHVEVTPIPHSAWERPAPTPLHAVLADHRLRRFRIAAMPDWQDAVQRYLQQAADLQLRS